VVLRLVDDGVAAELATLKLDGELNDVAQANMRLAALEIGLKIAVEKGKASHAPYIAADLYKFLLTGEKPKTREERMGTDVTPEAIADVAARTILIQLAEGAGFLTEEGQAWVTSMLQAIPVAELPKVLKTRINKVLESKKL